jgi:hypothetical protein
MEAPAREPAMSENTPREPDPHALDADGEARFDSVIWVTSHAPPEAFDNFPGAYVAVEGHRILTSGDDPDEVGQRADAMPGVNRERVIVALVRPCPGWLR